MRLLRTILRSVRKANAIFTYYLSIFSFHPLNSSIHPSLPSINSIHPSFPSIYSPFINFTSTPFVSPSVPTIEEIPHVSAQDGENAVIPILTHELHEELPHGVHQLLLRHSQDLKVSMHTYCTYRHTVVKLN